MPTGRHLPGASCMGLGAKHCHVINPLGTCSWKEGLRYAQVEPLALSRVTTNLSCSAESISHVVLEFSESISHVVLEGRGATLLQEHHWQQLYYPKDCVKTCNL